MILEARETCEDPLDSTKDLPCFPKNTEITVEVKGGNSESILRIIYAPLDLDTELECRLEVPCLFTFTTGESFDTEIPDGEPCADPDSPLIQCS